MDIQNRINRLIRQDLKRCEALYQKLISDLKSLETGSVTFRKGVYNWCNRADGKQFFKKIEDEGLLLRLRKRQFIKRAIPLLERRISNNSRYLKGDVFYDPVNINEIIPEQYKGLKGMDIFLENDINVEDWVDQEYKTAEMFKEGQHYRVDDNCWVRSKSEAMILMRLQENGFVIRYEPELIVGNKKFYPDFAILLPNSRRIVYYEHFGMIDNPEYAKKTFKKLKIYTENGIVMGYNLVFTFETRDAPLTLEDIDDVIVQLKRMDCI